MDEVVEALATAWLTGKKTLVFVRRVASVKELKQKLDERYDKWLIPYLRANLPESVHKQYDGVVALYKSEKREVQEARQARLTRSVGEGGHVSEGGLDDDRGGTDTFFAWFFRGDGPARVVSGANVQRRFIQAGSVYSTFFDRNYVAEVLGTEPRDVSHKLSETLGVERAVLLTEIRSRAAKYLSGRAKKHPRRDQFVAAQAAALELLQSQVSEVGSTARLVHENVYRGEVNSLRRLRRRMCRSGLRKRRFSRRFSGLGGQRFGRHCGQSQRQA